MTVSFLTQGSYEYMEIQNPQEKCRDNDFTSLITVLVFSWVPHSELLVNFLALTTANLSIIFLMKDTLLVDPYAYHIMEHSIIRFYLGSRPFSRCCLVIFRSILTGTQQLLLSLFTVLARQAIGLGGASDIMHHFHKPLYRKTDLSSSIELFCL